MKITLILLATVAACSAMDWEEYKVKFITPNAKKFGKALFSAAKEDTYKMNFEAEKKFIEDHNKKYENKEETYKLKLNQFAHLPEGDFLKFRTGRQQVKETPADATKYKRKGLKGPLPKCFDWRDYGVVTDVKDQGLCGGCYSFSTTATVEGQVLKLHGTNRSLSNQQTIDCSRDYGNSGCNGGMEYKVFKYLKSSKGVTSFNSYPYEERAASCRSSGKPVYAQVTDYKRWLDMSDEELMEVLMRYGPVCVAIHVVKGEYNGYDGGAFVSRSCQSDIGSLNHAVTLVGWCVRDGLPVWIIKNSWSSDWGLDGYLYISRAKNCGVTTDVSVPIVKLV